MSFTLQVEPLRWGQWEPTAPVDADLVAVIDVEVDDGWQLRGLRLACDPVMAGAGNEDLARLFTDDVWSRIEDFLRHGDRNSPWVQRSTGHWQLHVMRRWLPDFEAIAPGA